MPIALCPLSPLQLSLTANIIVVLTVFRGTRLTESHTRNGSYSAHKNRVGHASSTEFNSGNDGAGSLRRRRVRFFRGPRCEHGNPNVGLLLVVASVAGVALLRANEVITECRIAERRGKTMATGQVPLHVPWRGDVNRRPRGRCLYIRVRIACGRAEVFLDLGRRFKNQHLHPRTGRGLRGCIGSVLPVAMGLLAPEPVGTSTLAWVSVGFPGASALRKQRAVRAN